MYSIYDPRHPLNQMSVAELADIQADFEYQQFLSTHAYKQQLTQWELAQRYAEANPGLLTYAQQLSQSAQAAYQKAYTNKH